MSNIACHICNKGFEDKKHVGFWKILIEFSHTEKCICVRAGDEHFYGNSLFLKKEALDQLVNSDEKYAVFRGKSFATVSLAPSYFRIGVATRREEALAHFGDSVDFGVILKELELEPDGLSTELSERLL